MEVQAPAEAPTAPAEPTAAAVATPVESAEATEKTGHDQSEETEKPEATFENDKDKPDPSGADVSMVETIEAENNGGQDGDRGDLPGHQHLGEDGDVNKNGDNGASAVAGTATEQLADGEQTHQTSPSHEPPPVSADEVPEVRVEVEAGQQSAEEVAKDSTDGKRGDGEAEEDSMSVSEAGVETTPTEAVAEELEVPPEAEEAKDEQEGKPVTSESNAKKMARTKADALGEAAALEEKQKKKDKKEKKVDTKTKTTKKDKESSKAKKEKKSTDKKRKGPGKDDGGEPEATTKRRGGKTTTKEDESQQLAKAAAGTRTVLMAGFVFVYFSIIVRSYHVLSQPL